MLEKDVKNFIIDHLRRLRVFCWNQPTVGIPDGQGGFRTTGNRGVADVIGILSGGRFLAIEVKTEKGKVSEYQADFLRNVNEHGGVGIVAFGIDDYLEKIKPFLL